MTSSGKRKLSTSWLAFLVIVISVFILYGLDKMGEYISLLETIVTMLPIAICLCLAIVWANNSDRGKVAKVIGGIISGMIASVAVYYFYLEDIMEWIKDKQGTITTSAFVVILIFSFGLARTASKAKTA